MMAEERMINQDYHEFMDRTPNALIGVKISGELFYINTAGENLLRSQGLEVENFAQVLPPNYVDINMNCRDAEINIPVTRMELDHTVILWSPFFGHDKTTVLYSGVDITRMHRNEIALIEAKEKAEAGEKLKTAFMDNMSHEIRTPLNSLLGFMGLLHDELADSLTEDQKFYFNLIQENGARLERTMREILDMSNFTSGSYELRRQTFDMSLLIRGLIDPYANAAAQKGLKFTAELPHEALEITSDVYCVEQLISHLLDNAVKYTQSGFVTIKLGLADNKIRLQILDSGEGMGDALQRKIFVPFNQGSMGHSKKYQGIGLGLSLVRAYSDAIGGRINLESSLGVGSSYDIELRNI